MLYPIKWCFVQRCRTSSTLHLPLLPHSLPRWCATVYQRNCAHWLYIQAPHLRMSGKPHMSLCIWMCALLSRTDTGSCMGKPALTKNRWFRRYSVLVVALRYSMRMMHKLKNKKRLHLRVCAVVKKQYLGFDASSSSDHCTSCIWSIDTISHSVYTIIIINL